MSDIAPLPEAPSALSGMTRASPATPAPPVRLWTAAAMTPATNVPWPWSSEGSASSLTKSTPATQRPARSGASQLTPVSTTATVTPSPRDHSHAVTLPMAA